MNLASASSTTRNGTRFFTHWQSAHPARKPIWCTSEICGCCRLTPVPSGFGRWKRQAVLERMTASFRCTPRNPWWCINPCLNPEPLKPLDGSRECGTRARQRCSTLRLSPNTSRLRMGSSFPDLAAGEGNAAAGLHRWMRKPGIRGPEAMRRPRTKPRFTD